nr:aspartyl protease family protein 2 [Quercus suber]
MTPYCSFASYLRSSIYDALVLQVRTMLRSLQRCDRGSDMYNDLKFTLEVVDELGRIKLADALAEAADIDTQAPGRGGRSGGSRGGRRRGGGHAGPSHATEPEPIYEVGDEPGAEAEESWLQGDWVFSNSGTGPSHTADDAVRPFHTLSGGASQEYEALDSPPPSMGPSPPTPHKEVVQIEQILGEDIQPVEGLQRSRRPPTHAPNCGTGDDGAVWDFLVENYFILLEPEGIACLAIMGTSRSSLSIIGSYQQQNVHIWYDIKKSRLGYAPMKCADV